MRMRYFPVVLIALVLLLLGADGAMAQHEGHSEHKAPAKAAKPTRKKSTAKTSRMKKRTVSRSSQAMKAAPQTQTSSDTHQHGSTGGQAGSTSVSKMGMSKMGNGARHALAMAYAESIGTFAKTLRDQIQSTQTVKADFALIIVDEMRRNLDAIEQHHREHGASMPVSTQSQMGTMMQQMQTRITALRQALSALEQDFRTDMPTTSRVLQRVDEIISLTGEMSKASGHEGHKM